MRAVTRTLAYWAVDSKWLFPGASRFNLKFITRNKAIQPFRSAKFFADISQKAQDSSLQT